MKFFCQQLIKTPMLLVFVFMLIFYGIVAVAMPAEINQYAVVTAIGIDKAEEEENNEIYELTLLTFVPVAQQSFTEKYKLVNGKGRSVSEAMDIASLNIGREIGLSHLKMIVLSKEIVQEGVFKFLDYLIRDIQISSSTKIVTTDTLAKEFLKTAQKLDNESSIKVSEHILFNSEYIYSTESTLETFFKGEFGPTHVGLMACLSSKSSDEQTMPTAGSDLSNGSGGDGQQSSSAEEMITQCHVYVFKNEELVVMLGEREMKKVNFVLGDYSNGSIVVKNITDNHFNDANLTFEIFDNTISYHIVYQNGIPVVNIDTSLTLRLSEIEQESEPLQENVELYVVSQTVTNALEKKVRNSMADGINIMREHQVDIADFYTILHNNNPKAFHKFLDSLEDSDDYLNHIVFKVSVRIYEK